MSVNPVTIITPVLAPPVTPVTPMSTQPMTGTSTSMGEIKTALPALFSAKPSEASQWLKAMKAYFSINPGIYSSNKIKIALILSKMGTGKGISFSEKWYDKMANTAVKPKEKTFEKFVVDYNQNFNPFNTKVKVHCDISRLLQKLGKDEDGTPNDGFQEYINKFENLATKAQFEDKLTAITHFSTGLNRQISTMILSMTSPPDTLKEWIEKAKLFQGHKLCIEELRREGCYNNFQPQSLSTTRTTQDPNAMEVYFVKLKKLSPQEHAKCMREGWCFKCRKVGHDTKNCRTTNRSQPTPGPSHPQQILNTEEVPITPVTKPKLSILSDYTCALGKSEDEILQTLKLCYEEPEEEVQVVETFNDLEDFLFGKMFWCHLPMKWTMYS